jgi:hypothetical protein
VDEKQAIKDNLELTLLRELVKDICKFLGCPQDTEAIFLEIENLKGRSVERQSRKTDSERYRKVRRWLSDSLLLHKDAVDEVADNMRKK